MNTTWTPRRRDYRMICETRVIKAVDWRKMEIRRAVDMNGDSVPLDSFLRSVETLGTHAARDWCEDDYETRR